jgi:acyl carrier protein
MMTELRGVKYLYSEGLIELVEFVEQKYGIKCTIDKDAMIKVFKDAVRKFELI